MSTIKEVAKPNDLGPDPEIIKFSESTEIREERDESCWDSQERKCKMSEFIPVKIRSIGNPGPYAFGVYYGIFEADLSY